MEEGRRILRGPEGFGKSELKIYVQGSGYSLGFRTHCIKELYKNGRRTVRSSNEILMTNRI